MSVFIVAALLKVAIFVLAVIVIIILATKKGRMFAKAAIDSLFTEANKNPKIVAEYFDEKIARLQESYITADNAYRKASGNKLQNDKKIKELEKQLGDMNKLIVEAKNRDNIEDARMYADEAMSVKAELEARKENIAVFEEAMRSSGDLREKAKAAIQKAEKRKRADISRAETGRAAQEIYSQFDESRISSEIDRVLNQFSDYADEQEKMGLGAKASWDTSYEAKKISAEKRAKQARTDDYINNLVESMQDKEEGGAL